ncbi:alpha/beta hydrolase [Schauerella aestuarii]|uniref:alpha/beta hydrolase n=1 Tax=Schauerella aestuarii TaxID=2511204 RepID=UPI0013689B2D|nr:alpha/beta hydrolase-fold protein [Achromobacter aestuarii]MYZ43356.1 alpha/beta hydrolase [Achromobacter aestuarii]
MISTVYRRLAGLSLLAAMAGNALAHDASAATPAADAPAAGAPALASTSASASAPALVPADSTALPHTQVFNLTSRAGRDYRILVSVPPGEPPPEGYGVLVLLDANAYFGAAADAVSLLRQFPLIPEKGKLTDAAPTLVVGVAYPGDEPINGERRTWDFVPPAINPASLERLRGPKPGGADAFTTFLVDELRPALAAKYRVNAARQTLAGHSLGGYYVLHALATQPQAFQRYVSLSPAVWWDDSRILKDLAALKPGKAEVMLAMATEEWPGFPAGSAEMLDGARSARDVLARIGLAGDALRYVELSNQDHMTTASAMMPTVVRWASLPRP